MFVTKSSLTYLTLCLISNVYAASDDLVANTVAATTIASCNPLKTSNCEPDPALATSIVENFQSESEYYLPYRTPSEIFYGNEGLSLTLSKRFDNPSLVSNFYMMFGKVEVWFKSAPGTGVISSFYLQSDDLDEIDMEWFGGDVSQMQSNFFSKGDTTTYDRGEYHDMADPRADFHNYTIDWTESELNWYIDGNLVRTLLNNTSQGYPQTPMRIYFGIWAGGDPSNSEGTIEWAGGETNYSDAPFSMHIKSLVVSDYSSGTEYVYGGTSGDWTSIEAVDGSVNGRKAIAMAEFASLVNNGNIDSSISDSNQSHISSSSSSSSSSPSSFSFEESTTSSISSTSSTEFSSSEKPTTKTTESTSDEPKLSSHTKSKTVSLKSKYLSSSTYSSTIKTSTKHKTKESTSSEETSKTSSEAIVSSNHGNTTKFASSSIFGFIFMVLSFF